MLVHEIFDIFKGKEKTIGDDPQYKGWLKIYLKNPDAAEMHKDHKKFLQYFKQTNTNENFFYLLFTSENEIPEVDDNGETIEEDIESYFVTITLSSVNCD